MCGTRDGRGSVGEERKTDLIWEEYGKDDADGNGVGDDGDDDDDADVDDDNVDG